MEKKKRHDIRITDVPKWTMETIKANAKKEKRAINKQALIHIENDLRKPK